MTPAELAWITVVFALAAVGLWRLAVLAELGIRRVCDRIELGVAARRAPPPPPPIVRIEARQSSVVVLQFWNGCVVGAQRNSEEGRLAIASAYLGVYDWHKRPAA